MPQMSPLSARYYIGFYDMEQIYMFLLCDMWRPSWIILVFSEDVMECQWSKWCELHLSATVETCSFALSNFKVCPPIVLWSFSCFLFDHLWPSFPDLVQSNFTIPGDFVKAFPTEQLNSWLFVTCRVFNSYYFFAFKVKPWLKYKAFSSITCWKFAWLCFKCILLKCLILYNGVSNQLIELLLCSNEPWCFQQTAYNSCQPIKGCWLSF